MSTYINTNTTASTAAINLSTNESNESNDIEQLSTGLRINSASDDPAGLVVSENYKAQLGGLNAATANSNDAINETKTAESALNQVQNLLISVRQLAVQASNSGVNDATAVQADQAQIASAIQSINRISATTQFGDKYLLNGSATSALTTTSGSATASSGAAFSVVAQGTFSANNAYTYTTNQLSAVTQGVDSFATTNIAGQTPATLTAANTTFSGAVNINGTNYNLSTTTPSTLAQFNTAIAASGYQASFSGSGALQFTAQANGPVNTPSINASNLAISGLTSSIASAGTPASGVVTFAAAAGTGGHLTAETNANIIGGATPITVSGTLAISDTTAGLSFNSGTLAPGTTLAQLQTQLNGTFGTGVDQVNASVTAGGVLTFTGKAGDTFTDASTLSAFNTTTPPASSSFTNGVNSNLTIADGNGHSLTSTATQLISGTSYYSFSNGLVLSSAVAPVTTGTTTVNGALSTTAGATTTGTNLQYQLGANGGQTASLSIQSFSADQLGGGAASYTDANGVTQTVLTGNVKDINVTTFKGAQDAIAVLDQAISQVSTQRANLGAFETNVLQSNVTSLGVATTNLQSSESTVADADLASTVVDYTKNQILVSASTSALSYANQLPQAILKLLQ